MARFHRTNHLRQSIVELLESRRLLTTYYVDNAAGHNGSDSNSGTSLSTPFLTIQKAALTALPGDVVDICAGTYRETVTPANSGTAGAPITYQAYNGQKVVIDGANIVGGWSPYSGNIYESSAMTWTMGGQNDQLFVDGQMVNFARWPNTSLDVSHPTWELAGANTTGTVNSNGTITETVYDPNLTQPAGYWTGATIHIETGETWVYEAATITNYTRSVVNGVSYGVITYTSSFNTPQFYIAGQGDPYYITGDPYFTDGQFQDLDTPGTFYRDPNTGTVYLWDPSSDSPASHVIEAKARTWGFELSGLSYIDITGINLFACGIDSSNYSGHILINGINAEYVSHFEDYTGNWTPVQDNGSPVIGGTGIVLNGGNNTIENSTIAYSAGDGIFLWGNNNTVYNNVVHDVDYSGVNAAAISASEYVGVTSSGDSISYNTVYNGGRSLIDVSDMTASRIDNNQVYNAMLQAGDGAGIYGFEMNGNGTEIDHNYVSNSQNNVDGFPECGIFLDVNSTGVTIDHNVVTDCIMGIKNFDTQTNNILNNTVVECVTAIQIYGGTGAVENNITTTSTDFSNAASTLVVSNNLQSTTNPQFVNPAAGNYQLQSNSPAINAGLTVPPYTNGYVGSAPDDGAYEYGATAWSYGASGTAAVLAATAIPSPWSAADIGSPAIGGNSTYNNGIFAVTGSGTDIWNSADQFQFVSVPVSGDQTITARITSQGYSAVWAKAGVMFRSNSSSGSPFVMVTTTPNNGVNLLARDASGGLHLTGAAAIANPVWVKLVRAGNVFTAYDSADGLNWNTIGSITIALPAAGLLGLAVTSENATELSTAIFDNVSIPSLGIQAPTGLVASSATASSLSLSWNAAAQATGYQVQRSTDGVNFTTIATVGAVTSYTDSGGLSAATKYYYRVIATGSTGSSSPSSIVSGSTLTAAPAGLAAVAGYVQTSLSWTAVTGAVSYDIYRGTTSGGEAAAPIATGVTTTAYGDTHVQTGTSYYYYVTAVNSNAAPLNAQSAASNEASVSAGIITTVPGIIQAENYDLGGQGVAYNSPFSTNISGAYRNDGVAVEQCGDTGAGYDVGTTEPGEWINYTISVPTTGDYTFSPRLASDISGGTFQINIDGTDVSGVLTVPNTGGWQTYTTLTTAPVLVTAGTHVMRLAFDAAANSYDGNFNYITVASTSVAAPPAPTGLQIGTSPINVPLSWTASAGAKSYDIYRGTTSGGEGSTPIATGITSLTYADTNVRTGATYYYYVTAVNATGQSAASTEVSTVAGVVSAVPGVIQAENYDLGGQGVAYNSPFSTNISGAYRNDGVAVEQCGDTGGGYDVGTTEPGEWINYTISVPTTGDYTFSPRLASDISGGTFQINIDGTDVSGVLTVPNTGGWQTYTTLTTAPVLVTAGTHVMRLAFDAAANSYDGNFNYITVTAATPPTPQVPTALSATAGVGQVALSWTAGANDATYNVYRGIASGQESTVPIATGLTATSYTDTTGTAGVTYYYYVNAAATSASSTVTSAASNEVSAASLITAVSDGSFEQVSVTGAYTYDPVTPYWTFKGNAGIEANGSAWDAATAPGGTQAAFLQTLNSTSGGSISQNISVATAGTFDYTFDAAQRAAYGTQPIVVSIDGTTLATITPGSTSFASYTTPAISLAAGSHVLTFSTTPITAADGASFIDLVGATVLPNPPVAPSGVSATAGTAQISLTWTASTGAVSYNVYRGTTAGGEGTTPIATGVTATTYNDTTAVAGTRYYYVVTAVNAGGRSPLSTEATAGISAQLTGTPIGTQTSYLNNGDTIAQVFDGNLSTYFDAPNNSLTNWVGLDLGSAKTITQISYAPRAGYEFRMYGGQFQVSTTADFSSNVVTIDTINAIPTAGVLTTVNVSVPAEYRYIRYVGGTQWVNIAEMEVVGTN